MARVLVTGGGGFVGRVLVPALADAGAEVWSVDRCGPRRNAGVSAPKAAEAAGATRKIKSVRADMVDGKAVAELLERARADAIVHLAAQSSAGRSFNAPHETLRTNILPMLHVLEVLRTRFPQTRLLAVGSADVYGPVPAADMPLSENRPVNPVSPYALGKAVQEQLGLQYASLYGVDVVSTRSFNHTGAGQRDAFVLSSFARQIVAIRDGARAPVVETGNIDIRRDFLDVRDVCAAYQALLGSGRRGEVYNVCTGASHSLRELLETLARLAGVEIEIRVDRGRVRPVDMPELRGDPARIKRDTGWEPRISIEDTLRSLLDYWSSEANQDREGEC